jgi:hypothetical protein
MRQVPARQLGWAGNSPPRPRWAWRWGGSCAAAQGGSFPRWLGALALGVLVVVLVAAIPVAGGWLEALLVLLGLGALLLTARPGRRIAEPTAVSPAGGGPG